MKTLLNVVGTPLTAGLFVVSAVSGAALFFHWETGLFHSMHEWLSMVLLLPFVLHVWRNWKPLVGYLKRKSTLALTVASLGVAVPFAASSFTGSGGGNPAFRIVGLMAGAPVSEIAPLFKTTPEGLVEKLKQEGFQVASADETLGEVASASGVDAPEVILKLLPSR